MLFQQLPTNGLPPDLHDWTAFEAYYDQIAAAKMVSGPSEIRWDVRPAPKFGTVELRVTDASPTLTEIGCLAAWAQCLTEYIIDGELSGAPLPSLAPWFVRENKWRAARYGIDAIVILDADNTERLVTDDLADLLPRLAPIAERLGYNLRVVHIFVFGYVGLLAGIGGIVHASTIRLASPFDLVGTEMDVIAAVILGGARITGGTGTVTGTLLGVILVTLINNVMILAGVPSTWQKAVIGSFILLAGAVFATRKKK